MITATFKTREAAENTLRSLENMGITQEQMSLVVTDQTRGNSYNIEKGSKLGEGAAAGATVGGIAGALLGTLATASALTVPGLNIVVAGSLVSALAGLGAGATAGGLVGALVGAGIPEHEAKIYENEIKNGALLLAVKPESDEQKKQIKMILDKADAYNLAA